MAAGVLFSDRHSISRSQTDPTDDVAGCLAVVIYSQWIRHCVFSDQRVAKPSGVSCVGSDRVQQKLLFDVASSLSKNREDAKGLR